MSSEQRPTLLFPSAQEIASARARPAHRPFRAQYLSLPLATVGRMDATMQAIYRMLGLREIVYIDLKYGGNAYTTTERYLQTLVEAVDAEHSPGGPEVSLAAQAVAEPLVALTVPLWQPRVAPDIREAYQALGVDTIVVEFGGAQYTIIAESVGSAREGLASASSSACGLPSCAACAASGAPAQAEAPCRAYPAPCLLLASHYVGPPSPVIRTLAKMFGVSFARFADDGGAVYWVPFNAESAPRLWQTVVQLGLCA